MEAEPKDLFVTDYDLHRLTQLIDARGASAPPHLHALRAALGRATVVAPWELKQEVITLHSRFRLRDLDTGTEAVYTLVLPGKANFAQGFLSVLAPVGAALFGAGVGQAVRVTTPTGEKRFRVESIEYQPEASEAYHL